MEREDYIKNNILKLDSKGRVKCRERNDLEYKVSFGFNSWAAYAKTMVAFANNIGGYIIFGIKDNPREIVGVNSAFDEFKQEKFTDALNSLFSPEIEWECGVIDLGDKRVGYIYTWESQDKPIIAQKAESSEKINSGDVYYRYRARNSKIQYPEMRKIIEERDKREQERLMKIMEAIRNSNTTNLGIVNYNNGKISTPYGVDVTVDRRLIMQVLKKARYIKNGSFVEDGGQPVLRVTGNIDLAEEIPVPNIDPDTQYPYIQKDLKNLLGITSQQVYALIWLFGMKGQKKYHLEVTTSKNYKTHKFSKYALDFLQKTISEHNDGGVWLENVRCQYNQRNIKERN